jgi:hypothetical protein
MNHLMTLAIREDRLLSRSSIEACTSSAPLPKAGGTVARVPDRGGVTGGVHGSCG